MIRLKVNYGGLMRKALRYIVPLAVFWCVSAGCFLPQFEGKVLPQHDVQQYDAMWRDIRQHREATGEDAQWTGAMFGGMPAYLINVKYPSQAVKNSVGQIVKVISTPMSFIFFAMVAMWVMMMMFGISPWVGMVPALAYGLSTYFFLIIGAGHVTKMWALVYAPLTFGGIYVTLRGNKLAGGVLTALFASLEIGANHPQITYYFLIAAAGLWISELVFSVRGKMLKDFAIRTAILITAGIAAAGSNFAPLWYTSQHTPDTIRGGSELAAEKTDGKPTGEGLDFEYATAWSYGIGESWNMLIPDLMGGSSTTTFKPSDAVGEALQRAHYDRRAATYIPAYWGTQPFTAGPTYIGAAIIFLALLGALLASGRNRWWLLGSMFFMLLLSWGHNFEFFSRLCFKYLPMYNKFRTVSMSLVILEWGLPLMAGFGLWKVWNTAREERRKLLKPVAWAAGVTGGLCLLFAVAGKLFFEFGETDAAQMLGGTTESYDIAEAMARERAHIMAVDAMRSLLFIVLTAGALLLYACRKLNRGVMIALAAILVTADLALVNMRYLPHSKFVKAVQTDVTPTLSDRMIMEDTDLGYRVYNLTVSPFNDATTSNFHRSVGGYHGAKLSRYQDIIDTYLSGDNPDGVLDMLNTRYIIVNNDGGVYIRETANGAAWFVEEIIELPTAQEEIDALSSINTKTTAVASPVIKGSKRVNEVPDGCFFGKGEITLTEYAPNYLKYEYTADDEALAVFSEIYYDKGWTAYIDGEKAPYFRVDYILRGMKLPAGTHTVEWRFAAPDWRVVSGITLLFSIAILLAAGAALTIWILKLYKRYKS